MPAPARAAWPAPVESPAGAVAADHELASQAGAEILRQGGNAVDAAVATALALGVVQPAGSGLGGGGFLVARRRDGSVRVLDFREVAPHKAHRDMFLDPRTGKAVPAWSRVGGLAVAVPGEPAGLGEALRELGTMTPEQVVAPALRLAQGGFLVGAHLQENAAHATPLQPRGSALLGLIAPGGVPLRRGQLVRRRDLARTLEVLGRDGFGAFYQTGPGGIGARLVRAAQEHGGVLTEQDLAAYRPLWRAPLGGSYRGWTIFTAPPPAGGLTALEALQVLDARPPLAEGPLGSGTLHTLAEAFKHAFADRAQVLGDPAFVKVPTAELGSRAYARALAARIRDDAVLPPERYGKGRAAAAAPRDHGTTHLCVIDGQGNVAALTSTINLEFGSGVLGGDTGVILNDEMDDFSAAPGAENAFHLVGAEANAVAPGKRPLSSMSPLVAVGPDGSLLCAGASGGPTIVTGTVQGVVNVIEFKLDVEAAVAAPRLHAQFIPDRVFVEKDLPYDVQQGLRRRGHKLEARPHLETAVQMALRGPTRGAGAVRPPRCTAASDPRKAGAPAVP